MVESCWHLYAIWTLIRKVSQLFLCLLIHCINTTTNLSTTFSSFTWLLMGWPRLVGSLVLEVSFAKEPYQRNYILHLQKRPIFLRAYQSSSPHSKFGFFELTVVYLFMYLINTCTQYETSLILYCPSFDCEVEWHHSCCMYFIMVELCWHLFAIWMLIRVVSQLLCMYFIIVESCWHLHVGCNNGGGGGIFSRVKRLVAKWIGTWKRLFSAFLTARVWF